MVVQWSRQSGEVRDEVPKMLIGTVYPNIPLSSANHCNVFLSYRITPEVP